MPERLDESQRDKPRSTKQAPVDIQPDPVTVPARLADLAEKISVIVTLLEISRADSRLRDLAHMARLKAVGLHTELAERRRTVSGEWIEFPENSTDARITACKLAGHITEHLTLICNQHAESSKVAEAGAWLKRLAALLLVKPDDAKPAGDGGSGNPETVLDEIDVKILKILAAYNHAVKLADLAMRVGHDRDTCADHVKKLIQEGCAARKSKRSGVAITDAGRARIPPDTKPT